MRNMQVEYLKKEDLEQYKALMDTCFGESNPLSYYEENFQERAIYKILVAKEEGKVVGSITIYPIDLFTFSFQPALEVFNVAVLEEYRGKKIAKLLFQHVIGFAKTNKYHSIFLTCLDTAYAAHHLYESIGFKKMSSVKYSMSL